MHCWTVSLFSSHRTIRGRFLRRAIAMYTLYSRTPCTIWRNSHYTRIDIITDRTFLCIKIARNYTVMTSSENIVCNILSCESFVKTGKRSVYVVCSKRFLDAERSANTFDTYTLWYSATAAVWYHSLRTVVVDCTLKSCTTFPLPPEWRIASKLCGLYYNGNEWHFHKKMFNIPTNIHLLFLS